MRGQARQKKRNSQVQASRISKEGGAESHLCRGIAPSAGLLATKVSPRKRSRVRGLEGIKVDWGGGDSSRAGYIFKERQGKHRKKNDVKKLCDGEAQGLRDLKSVLCMGETEN